MARTKRSRKAKAEAPVTVAAQPLVTPETAAHGDYAEVEFVEKAGRRPVKVLRNRGGTAVERWLARGDLSRTQAEAIGLYARAWRVRFEPNERVTANWSLAPGGGPGFDPWVNQLSAKQLLERLDDRVFASFPRLYRDVWHNVVIDDEAAGVAGSRLGFASKQAEAVAKAIVKFIAEIIVYELKLGGAK